MNISGRCDYACRAMVELAARHQAGTPVPSQAIAEQRGIPEKYLTHILLQLKRSRLVRSMRGAQGGYMLGRDAETISLLDIIEAIEGPILYPKSADGVAHSELSNVWNALNRDINALLKNVTLAQMLDMTTRASMFHI